MVKDPQIVREETCCRHMGYSFRLTARVLLYAPSHRQDSTYHGLCYTSRGSLTGTRNSSVGSPHEGSIRQPIAPWANALTTELHLALKQRRFINACTLVRGQQELPGSRPVIAILSSTQWTVQWWQWSICRCTQRGRTWASIYWKTRTNHRLYKNTPTNIIVNSESSVFGQNIFVLTDNIFRFRFNYMVLKQ